jgi:hypothetical protein
MMYVLAGICISSTVSFCINHGLRGFIVDIPRISWYYIGRSGNMTATVKQRRIMMKMIFEGGEGRYFSYKGVNYLISDERTDGEPVIYAEVLVPDNAFDEYGYQTMKDAVLSRLPAETAKSLTWFYGDDEDLPDDAHAECEVFVDLDVGETRFRGII